MSLDASLRHHILPHVPKISPNLHQMHSFAGRTSTSKVVVRGTAASSRVHQVSRRQPMSAILLYFQVSRCFEASSCTSRGGVFDCFLLRERERASEREDQQQVRPCVGVFIHHSCDFIIYSDFFGQACADVFDVIFRVCTWK